MKVSNSKLPNSMPANSTDASKSAADAKKSGKLNGADSILDKNSSSGEISADGKGASARIDLSPRAHELRKAKELATPSDSVDEAKVARLQKMIDEGKYKVDADAVADKLLDEYGKMPS